MRTAGPLWQRFSQSRRRWLTALIVLPAAILGLVLHHFLVNDLPVSLEVLTLTVFVLLFAWISAGFWTAVVGFLVLLRARGDTVPGAPEARRQAPRAGVRVAVLMPIYNEDVARVAAGLRATYRSLERAGALQHFEFFLLSDTRDPAIWLREELAWSNLCQQLDGFGRIHYRRRPVNNKAKSGNVADFCRRWGKGFEYMVVLDADSIMSGETLYRMLEMMEGNPQVGILQTNPVAVNRETLYARLQQFAQQLYGPLFSAGLRFWQLGDGHYIGHNAMLRTAPFTEFCALPVLPGKAPLGGALLSHDFVEAALMARAGWEVWFVPDLGGSYEEVPPTLLDDLKRDRRWAQGNLQHLRLLAGDGLQSAHRFLFINGAMSFLAAPLWGLFLGLGALASWQMWRQGSLADPLAWAGQGDGDPLPLWLIGITVLFLLGPKLLAVLWIGLRGGARQFGGLPRLFLSTILESVFSILLAPVRMVFHSLFVIQTLRGRSVQWGAQVREDAETTWSVAWQNFGWCSAAGVGSAAVIYPFVGGWHFLWLLPVVGGLALAVPLAALTSRPSWGRWARAHGLFLIPEEVRRPQELLDLDAGVADALPSIRGDAFVEAVVDPSFNALHSALQRDRSGLWGRCAGLVHKALAEGPECLSRRERNLILSDRQSMLTLHRAVWSLEDPRQLAAWGLGRGPADDTWVPSEH
ncbi:MULTISPECIES: glucans biosynthesis glucosyltransferase MdoH [Acidithiobacillus]|uniref:Glucans biosynthesis glucosyltransferase H n=3 Tax=Acidithiobacillus caldus TaxID=33059 RepID=A0A059ZWK2_ACICK|nr:MULTISPECIES: glucans biosynthesis glucosyltransferase MdoH [Acidithiobacillus]AIA55970.1 Glucans biosynthesis glucosyltransferase H [Acidithiobacillus caldus ATCC 51756]MBU2728355.1 glucans biosynthesis glucosyltransferase MdoH [Acidithiobacillus caldus]MBU2737096.1 glucans biosynthesis glucosyltransferase MdoH [Acidithiobacillus caldus ATCC 51756]MBU2744449.1 glucans biosynthesis glucosyltransferase MdoH [Acidithiobacillus caldus]MBU2780552.1 glucans biosynthesis glucosyltransferase MdoH 